MPRRLKRLSKIGVGIIGAGIGRHHMLGYALCPEAEMLAVCDSNEVRAQKAAAEFSIPRIYADYRDLLADKAIDVVSICTPNFLHAPMTIAAFEAGKHVICEKPLALNPSEGEAMVAAGRKAGRLLMLAFNNRFREDTLLLKKMIEKGELGEIYYAKAGWLRRKGIPGKGKSWFSTKAKSGGGPLIDLGVHMLDLALWLMGNPRAVTVSGSTYAKFGPRGEGLSGYGTPIKGGTFDVEDLASAFLRLDNGATLTLEASWASHVKGDITYLQLLGTKAGAEINPLRIYKDVYGTVADIAPGYVEETGHTKEIRHFIDCLLQGTEPMATGEQGLEITRIIEAVYLSAKQGREISLLEKRAKKK